MGFLDIFKNTSFVIEKGLGIKDFNKTVIDDYFRAYLFKVDITGAEAFACEWVATTATPVMLTTVQNIDYMHTQIKQAGRTTPQQWQVTVRDDAGGKAFKYFNDWRNLVYPNIKNTSVNRYKRTADVRLISPSGSAKYRTYKISGLWPFELGATTLDYDSEAISIFPVTLSFDYFEVTGQGE